MAAFVKTAIPNRYVGASSDTKPTGVGVGSMCYEYDTGATYITYDGTNWSQYAPTTYLTDISAETLTLSGTTGALTFSGAATIVAASGLTIPAFTLGGKLTAGASEIEGSAFDINGGTIASVTLDGSIAGGDQSWTNVGDMTFAAGSILKSGSTAGNTLLIAADDTTFFTLTTGATDTCTVNGDLTFASGKGITSIGNIVFQAGASLASGPTNGNTLLFKANDTTFLTFTTGATDTLDIGAHTISGVVTSNSNFDSTGTISAWKFGGRSATTYLLAYNGDGASMAFQARDTGVGLVEVARMAGAADPYFAVGNHGNAAKFYHSGAVEIVGASTFTGAATFNGDLIAGTLDIDDDSGVVTLVDMGVTDAPADGTEESYAFKLDGNTMFTIYGKSDGAGAVDELSLNCGTYIKLHITDTDGIAEGQIWYDASENKLKFKTASGVETISSS